MTDDLKLAIAKLVCCGSYGCMKMIPMDIHSEDKCWCEIPEFKGSGTEATAVAVMALFKPQEGNKNETEVSRRAVGISGNEPVGG